MKDTIHIFLMPSIIVGSNPTPWPGIFFNPARCGYTPAQSNITQASYSPEYITPTQQKSFNI